jgi:hypothetical protein
VPRFGVGERTERWPIVVLLSNDIRHDLSVPMRSRCLYSWVELPTPREGISILCSRVAEAGPAEVAWVAKILDSVQDVQGMRDKPALREGISLLKALVRDGVREINEQVLLDYLCAAKRHNDRDCLTQSLGRVAYAVNIDHPEIDRWVEEEFAQEVGRVPGRRVSGNNFYVAQKRKQVAKRHYWPSLLRR